MKNPKEKAQELIGRFIFASIYFTDGERGARLNAIFCAKQCVDEIIKELPTEVLDTYKGETNFINNDRIEFWLEVKQHLTNEK